MAASLPPSDSIAPTCYRDHKNDDDDDDDDDDNGDDDDGDDDDDTRESEVEAEDEKACP